MSGRAGLRAGEGRPARAAREPGGHGARRRRHRRRGLPARGAAGSRRRAIRSAAVGLASIRLVRGAGHFRALAGERTRDGRDGRRSGADLDRAERSAPAVCRLGRRARLRDPRLRQRADLRARRTSGGGAPARRARRARGVPGAAHPGGRPAGRRARRRLPRCRSRRRPRRRRAALSGPPAPAARAGERRLRSPAGRARSLGPGVPAAGARAGVHDLAGRRSPGRRSASRARRAPGRSAGRSAGRSGVSSRRGRPPGPGPGAGT